MFLVSDPEREVLVFTNKDPRVDGFEGDVKENVRLEYPEDVNRWADGSECTEQCLGFSESDPLQYRVFRTPQGCRATEFIPTYIPFELFSTWTEYLESRQQGNDLKDPLPD